MFTQAWLPTPAQQVGVTRRQEELRWRWHHGSVVKPCQTNQRLLSFWHQSQGSREVNKYTHISFRLQPKSEHSWGLTPPNRQKAGEVEDRRQTSPRPATC
jgi:hypothetical protein